jgi:hypothetical protein
MVFVGLALACARWPTPRGAREALLRAALVFGAIVTVVTEALSLFDGITASSVTTLWLALGVTAGIGVIRTRAGRGGLARAGRERAATTRGSIAPLIAAAFATILGATLLIAVVAPPDYPDVMTYHMGRVAHWIQARSVDYYPTGIERQNYQMPFAEFVILHLQLLSGGDRWANLVQWAAFALSGVTVSLILAELGQAPRVQWAGALVVYSTPMAILEASGAQNDVVVALWLLAFLLYLWRGLSDPSLESAVLCGLALGLALLTKGTAYLFAPAMAAALFVGWVVRAPRGKRLPPNRHWIAAILIASCLNLGPWLRNMSTHGKPICCGESYFVDRLTPGGAYSNVLRNAALHLGIPKLMPTIEGTVDFLSPVPLDDPATTFNEEEFDLSFSYHEGKAGNILVFLAAMATVAAIAFDRRLRRGPATPWMAAAVAGFLAFSIALNWQPWASRLHTPVFLAASIPVAVALATRSRWVRAAALAVFFLGSLPYVLLNESRPLLPVHHPTILTRNRTDQYFIDRPAYRIPYREAAAFVRASGEEEVGLLFDEDDYEYPFWVMIKTDFTGPPILRHVGVTGRPESGAPSRPPPPSLVVASRGGERHRIDGFDYVRIRDFDELSILRRVAAAGHAPGEGRGPSSADPGLSN